jgi:MFS family permease
VLTLLTVSSQTIAVIGPTLGGVLIGLGGWRTVFSVNVPLAVACLVLGALRLPKAPPSTGSGRRLDLAGIGLFAAALVSLLLFLMSPDPGHAYLLALCVALGAGFALREWRTADPFLDLRVLGGNPALLATYARTLLTYVVSYSFIYGYTQWLEDTRGLSASQAGLVLLPVFLTGIVMASLTGRHREVRGKLLGGALAQVLACALLLFLHAGSPIWLLVAVGAVIGLPGGTVSLANQNAIYHQADPARMGSSAGLQRTFMYLSAMIASAAFGAFFGRRADTPGLHHLGTFMLVIAVLFLAVTVVDRSLARIGREPPDATQEAGD